MEESPIAMDPVFEATVVLPIAIAVVPELLAVFPMAKLPKPPLATELCPIAIALVVPLAVAPDPIEILSFVVVADAAPLLAPIFTPPANTIPPAALDMFNPLPLEEGTTTVSVDLPIIS
jgi:hypothetical protein